MNQLPAKFKEIVIEYMRPWEQGEVPVKLKAQELIAFAAEFFSTMQVCVTGEGENKKEITYLLDVDMVNESMRQLGFEREVSHTPFDGLQVSWKVALVKKSSLNHAIWPTT